LTDFHQQRWKSAYRGNRSVCEKLGLTPGKIVTSKEVGCVPSFLGEIIEYTRDEIVVKDIDTGEKYVRSIRELEHE